MTENTQNENVVNDIITLIDEEDNSMDFKLVDVMELDGQRYAVLQPCGPNPAGLELGDDEAIIFRLDKDEKGEETFSYIEDDKEWDTVVNAYNDMLFEED